MTIEEEIKEAIKELKKEYLGDSESLKEAKKIAVKALNEKQKRLERNNVLAKEWYSSYKYKGKSLLEWAELWFKTDNDTFFRLYGFNFNPHIYPGLYQCAREELKNVRVLTKEGIKKKRR
jgi:hypothetical protein